MHVGQCLGPFDLNMGIDNSQSEVLKSEKSMDFTGHVQWKVYGF